MNFRGHNVEILKNRALLREYPDKFVYGIRSHDTKHSIPCTVEKRVMINFWGQLISDTEIDLGSQAYIELTPEEAKEFQRYKGV